jgi:exopolyphosphatase / guanosine-5'-triphosphate,3'-diphosphate pyrophosphatase
MTEKDIDGRAADIKRAPCQGGESQTTAKAKPQDNLAEPQHNKAREQDSHANASARDKPRNHNRTGKPRFRTPRRFAALDLGTNNCRLLVVAPRSNGFRVIDAFSRIVRLGEGVSQTGRLSEAAMARTIEALKTCSEKIAYRQVSKVRCIATQACRGAENGVEFLHRIKQATGLSFDMISTEEEATLAVRGCHDLIDDSVGAVLVFDIGGGSTELSWVLPAKRRRKPWSGPRRDERAPKFITWMSIPYGVVNVSERFGGTMTRETYDEVVNEIADKIRAFSGADSLKPHFQSGNAHLLGTSGTVTSLAGLHLKLKQYNRQKVDGIWLSDKTALSISEQLRAMSEEERNNQPCIGRDRADLVVPGCAILEAIMMVWPSARIRVADRGLREGVLASLMEQDRRERAARKARKEL